MGQHQNKLELNQQFFESVYEQNQSHEYFTHTKGFGYRKTNIKPGNSQKILACLKNGSINLEENIACEKQVKKKQFHTSIYPYSCIGMIIATYKDRCSFGTGCLIGPDLILTAATNIYRKDTDEHPEIIRFSLNIHQAEGDVYRVKTKTYISQHFLEETTGSHRYNYAVLEIQKQEYTSELTEQQPACKDNKITENSIQPGLVYGYFGINTKFSGMENIYIYGYSIEQIANNQVNFTIRGQKLDKLMCKNGSIGYKMESSPSECGSPILIRRNQYFHIVGIHISSKKDLGSGLQIDEDIRRTINNWIVVKEGRMNLSTKNLDSKSLSLLNSKDWKNLIMLNLDNNNLMCSGLIVLTHTCWPVLRELHVCNNSIAKLEFDSSSLINLQVLYLTKNYIKEIILLSQLSILRVLELSDNRIEDIMDLLILKYLERLYLNKNKLYKIPSEIQRLAELKKLQLSKNFLEVIPNQMLKLKNLSAISLDQNLSKFETSKVRKQLQLNNVQVILN